MTENTVNASLCEMIQILPQHAINGAGRMLGGYMLTWMDEVAAASAKRFCRSAVTTACIDSVDILAPAFAGELFCVRAFVTRAGRTSVEVKVEGTTEHDDGTKTVIFRGYAVVVALDENGKPAAVPKLICETEEQQEELQKAQLRDELRRKRREINNPERKKI